MAEAFLPFGKKKFFLLLLFSLILGHFGCSVVTSVTFKKAGKRLKNPKKNLKNPKQIAKKSKKNPKNPQKKSIKTQKTPKTQKKN